MDTNSNDGPISISGGLSLRVVDQRASPPARWGLRTTMGDWTQNSAGTFRTRPRDLENVPAVGGCEPDQIHHHHLANESRRDTTARA